MIVMKFGGTSVKDAAAVDRAAAIVAEQADRSPLVVVSALSGVTSSLLEVSRLAGQRERAGALSLYERIRAQHLELLEDLEPDLDELRGLIESPSNPWTRADEDQVAAFGERLSSQIFASRLSKHLEVSHVDSRRCLLTDDRFGRATPNVDETSKRLESIVRPLLKPGFAVVMGGYIGSTLSGQTSTLGRGGSDYSATLFGGCLGAEEVQIWTDVDGMMTADPRIVPEAYSIKSISFAEAAELAYFGAKVLHPLTLRPAVDRGIPVRVLNSMRPASAGTVITAEPAASRNPVTSLASKRHITAVTVTSSRMLMAHGFLKRLFEVFDKHETAVDVVTTSEVSVSLTLDDDDPLDALLKDLEQFGSVSIESPLALICVVGTNLKDRSGVASQVFACLEDISIRMISQGASHINLSFLVNEDQADTVVRRLHAKFFSDVDPNVFAPVE